MHEQLLICAPGALSARFAGQTNAAFQTRADSNEVKKMMLKRIISTGAAAAAMFAMAHAEDCTLNAEAPAMPDPAAASEADVDATVAAIKAFQGELGAYRECLDAISSNKKLEKDVRQAALDKYNASVDAETAMVEDWQAFYAAYKDAQS